MKKRGVIGIALIILLSAMVYSFYDQMQLKTYGDVLENMLNEDESITEISIIDYKTDRYFSSDNSEIVEKFTIELLNMDMKRDNNTPLRYDYVIFLHTNKGNKYDIAVGLSSVEFGYDGRFTLINENTLYANIEKANIEWEPARSQ
ncbi:hypothetical protein [Alkalihalobacillus sp. LMS39]|uniref:hypothetical protein n=1 Tax=Alkalihalobacillus sp. LMS39 TaxID=2924032 RepID=UPI001FB38718|nr:hypothetical protein [Alkalihalobacillus sp. LMS39]UOE95217.1 hypothetical protein MM271_06245 [Alkalihalobacillus sp. LMS39]